MKTQSPIVAVSCVALLSLIATVARPLAAAETFRYTEGTHDGGSLKYVNGVPVLTVRGTPEQIGTQTARLTADVIRPLMTVPRKVLKRHGVERAWPLVVLISRQLMLNAPAAYREELKATVTAAGFGRDELTVGNTMLELRRIGGCSTLYVSPERSKTGRPMMGRNFDFDPLGVLDRFGLVTVVQPKGKKSFASVGFPATGGVISGMNEDGLCVATLDVYRAADDSTTFNIRGVPLTYAYRRLLEECSTIAEAEKLLRSLPRTTRSNLAVCDKHGAAVLEFTPKTLVVRRAEGGVLPCTNHFRTKELARGTTCRRYASFLAGTAKGKLGRAELIKQMHAVNQGSYTIHSMIFEPVDMKLHVALGKGPVTAGPFRELDLAKLFKR